MLTHVLDDSPYYLGQRNTSFSSEHAPNQGASVFNFRKSADSENDDLRSVIDDLTIKNKRLKRRLKHMQRSSLTPSANDNRLFEVRIHELSGDRKHELEEILRNFASSFNQGQGSGRNGPSGLKSSMNASETALTESSSLNTGTRISNGQSSYASLNNAPAVSKISAAVPSDSAYASMSQLGRSNTGVSSNDASVQGRSQNPPSNVSKDRKIQSYLRDIPQSLLPQHNPIMSERTKMKAVVRRLEQVFTGTQAAPGEHSLPLQQQAISDSAARADQAHALQSNRALPAEGSREARILPENVAKDMDKDSHLIPRGRNSTSKSRGDSEVTGVVDQRPTRPLDLDMHRAQVAADNIEYIRHLGLSYPPPVSPSAGQPGRWVYLNLLVGMAQLHMLNVTPEFIRESITSQSNKLELSKDGRKLRWNGGTHGTAFSSESGSNADGQSESSPERTSHQTATGQAPQQHNSTTVSESKMPSDSLQRSKLSDPDSLTGATGHWSGKSNLRTANAAANPLDYKPLFVKQPSTDSDESGEFANGISHSLGVVDTTIAPADSCFNSQSKSKTKSENDVRFQHGPIVFYNNSSYFTDLSGDRSSVNQCRKSVGEAQGSVLGAPRVPPIGDKGDHKFEWPSLPPENSPPDCASLDIKMGLSPFSRSIIEIDPPYEFEASGIGGVIPSDNFVMSVQIRHDQHRTIRQNLTGNLLSRRHRISKPSRHQVLSARYTSLPASSLPPPSYIFPFSSLSSSNVGDLNESFFDDGAGSSGSASRLLVPHSHPGRLLDLDGASDSTDSDMSSETDSEIDMLKSARALDPAAVLEQERAFEAANIGLINQDMPPGSSAATAGGLESDVESNPTSHGSDEEDNNRARSLKRSRSETGSERKAKAPRVQVEQH